MSITRQCDLLQLSRGSVYYEPVPAYSTEELAILNVIDEIYTATPFYGHRKVWQELARRGFGIGRDRTLRFMRELGLTVFYPKPRTSVPDRMHTVYPYLLKGLNIDRPNQVWAADITYIRMKQGFCFLVAIIDWYSRAILSHRISNSMDVGFCVDALNEALEKYPAPDIFNSDQGSQFTSDEFTKTLLGKGIKISMDSVGRATDNIIIERFWRSLKYEDVYLSDYQSIQEVKSGIKVYMEFYNLRRLHATLDYRVPFQVYLSKN